MQNFSDDHLPLIDGVITAPSGGGAEAFVDADDIAAVAVATLLHPAPTPGRGNADRPAGPHLR